MKKALNIVAPILTVIVLILECSCANKNAVKIDYCSDIYKEVNGISGQFRFSEVDYSENLDSVAFIFNLKDRSDYDADKGTTQVIAIRKTMIDYLNNNPQNELNTKRIYLSFQTLPGDSFSLFNFDHNKEGLYNDFPFCYDVTVNSSNYESFINAFSLSIKIESSDELKILEKFERLEYLNLYGPEISDDEREYIRNTLPDCEIYYNDKLINKRAES